MQGLTQDLRWLDVSLLVSQKRGPKTRRTDISVENRVVELRNLFLNRYDIVSILRKEGIVISPATIHNIFVRNGLNKLSRINKEEQVKQLKPKKIIMIKGGELFKYRFV